MKINTQKVIYIILFIICTFNYQLYVSNNTINQNIIYMYVYLTQLIFYKVITESMFCSGGGGLTLCHLRVIFILCFGFCLQGFFSFLIHYENTNKLRQENEISTYIREQYIDRY